MSSRGYVNPDDARDMRRRYTDPTGQEWTLWVLSMKKRSQVNCAPNRWFCKPTNYGKLSTNNTEYGVTWQQIAQSSFEGWRQNGQKNNYPQKDPTSNSPDPLTEPWKIPGFWNLPVCHDFGPMQQNRHDTGGCDWDPCCHTAAS